MTKLVYNNSSLSFRTRRYDITGNLLRSNKFIICFAYFLFLKCTWNWGNIAILVQKNCRRAWHVISTWEVKGWNLQLTKKKRTNVRLPNFDASVLQIEGRLDCCAIFSLFFLHKVTTVSDLDNFPSNKYASVFIRKEQQNSSRRIGHARTKICRSSADKRADNSWLGVRVTNAFLAGATGAAVIADHFK